MSGRREHLVYTDGSCKAGEGAAGGWGFVIRPPSGPSVEGRGSAKGTLAKVMEYRAVAEALAALPDGARAVVFSDNQSLALSLAKHLPAWSACDFANVDPHVVDIVRKIAGRIAAGMLTVEFRWIRSHNGNAGNERADALAAQAAREAKAELEAARR